MSGIFDRLKKKRGVTEDFLKPRYENLSDPFILPDINKAVSRVKTAIERNEKVLIFGDYDADGVTASSVICEGLEMAGINVVGVLLPDRFTEGYGMSERVVVEAKEKGATLVITVDCGSANAEIIDELNKIGVETIVTDHHECPEKLPEAVAVINPKRKDAEVVESLKNLAGVGVAFFLVRAMVKEGLIKDGQEKWLLDLVAIGTICDNMVLLDDNRILCFFGLIVLNKTRRIGIKELLRVAGAKEVNSETVGFVIGPRLNAAGRMKTAEIALELLRTKSKTEAARLAKELNDLNYQRKEEQKKAVEEIKTGGKFDNPVIVVKGKWNEGILGIIAGRLTEEYKKPAFAFALKDGVWKGSGRSFGEFNLKNALNECEKLIIGGGGHAGACGVKVKEDGLEDFERGVNEYYKELKLFDQERYLIKKEDVATEELGEFKMELLEEIKKLEPFGEGNPEPAFLLKDVFILNTKIMGTKGEHLSLYVRGSDEEMMKLVAFYAPEEWMEVEKGMRADILVGLTSNEWNGITSVEGRIEKMTLVSEGDF